MSFEMHAEQRVRALKKLMKEKKGGVPNFARALPMSQWTPESIVRKRNRTGNSSCLSVRDMNQVDSPPSDLRRGLTLNGKGKPETIPQIQEDSSWAIHTERPLTQILLHIPLREQYLGRLHKHHPILRVKKLSVHPAS